MKYFPQIINKAKEGVRSAVDDVLLFSDNFTQKLDTEYLLTVNVAKKIAELNSSFGFPFKIYLERKTRRFSTECLPAFRRIVSSDSKYGKLVTRKRKNTSRNGKIDLTIYEFNAREDVPICAIEMKGFNPQSDKVIMDLVRNVEYFTMAGETGNSVIEFASLIALYSCDKTYVEKDKLKDVDQLRDTYATYMAQLQLPGYLDCLVDVYTVRDWLISDDKDQDVEQVIENRHHFVAVLASIFRR